MDRKEEFLARLRETFRNEASEHLEAISAGLLAIEHADGAGRAQHIERIFRETHSFKGAARSVSLTGVEALCLALESIFAAMKDEKLVLSTAMLDVVHQGLGVLAFLCSNPGATPPPEEREKELRALAALQNIVWGTASPQAAMSAGPIAPPLTPARSKKASLAATAKAAPAPAAAEPGVTSAAPDSVRVSMKKLSAILIEAENLVGAKIAAGDRAAELRTLADDLAKRNRGRLRQAARQRQTQKSAATATALLESERFHNRSFEHSLKKVATAAQQDALALAAGVDKLLADTKKVLLFPCSYLLGPLPKIVRELAREQGKEAELIVRGEDIEVDRRVLDEVKNPLMHLLRNSIDHGIEKPEVRRQRKKPGCGSITITVKAIEGNRIEINVADDGSGVDAAKVRKAAVHLGLVAADAADRSTADEVIGLIFHSGLSTSPLITKLSGRGLGLAIVREKIETFGGTITVTSTPGAGTAFRLLVPLSLATFRGVFVAVAGQRFVIPTASVVRVGRVKADEVKTVGNRQTLRSGELALSLVRLRDILELSGPEKPGNGTGRPVVVARAADRQAAFLVDEVLGEQETMVKSLGRQLSRVRNIAGAAKAGSGAIIPILNVVDLLDAAGTAGAPGPLAAGPDSVDARRTRLLIAEDSITARTLLKSILEGAGYEVKATVDGMEALTMLKIEPFDLLVSDIDMPRLNGFELTARIRADKKLGGLPVVLVTALASQQDREYGIEVGADAYIVKSDFDQGNLLEIIRRLL